MNTVFDVSPASLYLTVTFLFFTQQTSYATDTIHTQALRDNGATIISSGGSFELGFFSPEASRNRYVGIWYKKTGERTVVWVANRDDPLPDDASGTLRIVDSGRLVLVNGTNDTIWSTNTSRNTQNSVAKLLDSGNLVVKDGNDDNRENFLWQSFDYPTDTLLPGMKLGRNFATGHEVRLTSSRSSDDPATGDYTFRCDPAGYPQNVIERGASVRFKSGPWNGVRFSGSRMNKNSAYTYGVVINKNEVYYHSELVNDSVYTRLVLADSGVAQRLVWLDQSRGWDSVGVFPVDSCDMYNKCGAYSSCNPVNSPVCVCLDRFKPKDQQRWDAEDWSSGCVRNRSLDCQKGDSFLKYSEIKFPDSQHSWYNDSMNLEECRLFCLKNCSCTAYSSLDISGKESGCLLWFGDLVNMRDARSEQGIYIRMASSESGSKGKTSEILLVMLSVVVLLLLGLSLLLYSRKRKKQARQLRETGMSRHDYGDNHPDESQNKDLDLPQFGLATIAKATDNFSIENKLGEGGFGPVFRGLLDDGREIAVKRLSRTSLQGADEFKNEVICIAKLQHRNLVKLLGWCIEGEEKMLVYEYMINKSLDLILFDPSKSMCLDWRMRFHIINGIARGLLYLHQDSCLRVIHRDLKTSNILLDSDMNPKISDFGLAKTFGGNETGANTCRVVGTYGYMSPEYAVEGLFSVKSDVFSFGVLVLEIVSGKRNRGFSHKDHRLNLLGHAWMLYREERSVELVDSCIRKTCNLSEALRSIQVGLLCVQDHPEDRPSMSSTVLMLSNDSTLPEAKYPGFFSGRDVLKTETSISSSTASSTNAMSVTQLEAR